MFRRPPRSTRTDTLFPCTTLFLSVVKPFTKRIADAMAADSPDRFVATVTKSKRKGKILVDYLRNGRGATAVAPYSTRSRPGAPVAMPIGWDELGGEIGPPYFTVANAPTRLESGGARGRESGCQSGI